MKKEINKYSTIILCYGVNFILPILFFKEISLILSQSVLASFFFVLALLMYCQFVVEYGLQISLLKKLNENKGNLGRLISTVIGLKIILFLICAIFIYGVLQYNNEFVFSILIFMLLGNVFSCQFLYQVVDQLHLYYVINTFFKLMFIPLIFVSNNYIYLITCYSLFNIIPNLMSFAYFIYKHKIEIVLVAFDEIYNLSKKCFSYFVSNISITLYTNFYQVLLGFISPSYLAAYALTDKIIRSIVSGNYVFIQLIQVQYLNDESKFESGVLKTLILLLLLGGAEFLFVFVGADFFSWYLFPKIELLPIFLKLMSLLIIIILLSNFFAMVYLPCTGKTMLLSRVFIFVSIISVIIAPISIFLYAGYGAIFSAIMSELLVLVLCYGLYLKLIRTGSDR